MTQVFFLVALLGILLQTPVGSSAVRPDIAELRTRAEAGDPRAQTQLGLVYASGDGIEADESEAVKWFRKAAEKGDPAGEYSLEKCI